MSKFINPFTDVGFKRIFLSKQERQLYDESLRQYRDTLVVMEGQYLEGEEKGRAEGKAEGKQEVARMMKDNNVPAEQISLYTGLSIQDVENL
jgi:predicted transposase/invertase (TIGR01784 family)